VVVQRRHETGVRVALGASGADVLKLVFSETVVVAPPGLSGLAASVPLPRLLRSLFSDMPPS